MADVGARPLADDEIRQLEPVLYRFALRATRDPELSRDLSQETLLAALTQRAEFAGRSSLRTWVVGILAHKVTDQLRARARSRVNDDDDAALLSAPAPEDVERAVAARQELRAVDRALQRIPERERLALLLVDVEGVEREEVCNVLGVEATHLRVLLHRGRNRLRTLLEHG